MVNSIIHVNGVVTILQTLTKISGLVAPLRIGAMHGSHVDMVKACAQKTKFIISKKLSMPEFVAK